MEFSVEYSITKIFDSYSLTSDIYKVSLKESGLTQSAKKLLAHAIFVGAFLLLPDWGKKLSPEHVDIFVSLRMNA